MASEKNLKLKKDVVNKITNQIEESEAVVLFTYQGLSVTDMASLRRDLREVNSEIKVYKNTLVKFALDSLKLDLDEYLAGPNAILFGKNLLDSIKVLDSFAKEHKTVEIKAGVIKGDLVSLETIKEYASIPSMEGLLTMLAGGMIEHVKNLSISLDLYAKQIEERN